MSKTQGAFVIRTFENFCFLAHLVGFNQKEILKREIPNKKLETSLQTLSSLSQEQFFDKNCDQFHLATLVSKYIAEMIERYPDKVWGERPGIKQLTECFKFLYKNSKHYRNSATPNIAFRTAAAMNSHANNPISGYLERTRFDYVEYVLIDIATNKFNREVPKGFWKEPDNVIVQKSLHWLSREALEYEIDYVAKQFSPSTEWSRNLRNPNKNDPDQNLAHGTCLMGPLQRKKEAERSSVSGHLKTGQAWSLQNQPL
jgi:hypothetical protein